MELWHSSYNSDTGTLFGTHNAGFYSCINCVRMSLYKLLSNNIFPKDISLVNTLHQYKDFAHVDLFKLLYTINLDLLSQINMQHEFEMFCPTNTKHSAINFKFTHPIDSAYFSPSLEVNAKEFELMSTYDITPCNTMAVLHRGTDKWKEATMKSLTDWIDVIDGKNDESLKILIQTDDKNFLHGFTEYFGDRCFYIKENVFGSDRHSNVIPLHKRSDWAITFEAIMRIISKCKKIINHTGNCALVPVLYRGCLQGETQLFNDEIIDYDLNN